MKIISFRLFSIGVLSAFLCGQLLADDPRDAAVTQDMNRMKTAMTTQDYATLIDLMYGPIVLLGGGKATMVERSKEVMSTVTFESFEAIPPYTYVAGTTNDYVIVKTHMTLSANGHHIESDSFELGIKPHQGDKWQYLDGAGLKPQIRERFLSDLPTDTVLPEVQHKQLD